MSQLKLALITAVLLASGGHLRAQQTNASIIYLAIPGETSGILLQPPTGLSSNQTFTFPTSGGELLILSSPGVSPSWLLGGNATAAAESLGSTSGFDVSLIANNNQHLRLVSSGNTIFTRNVELASTIPLIMRDADDTHQTILLPGNQTTDINYTLPATLPSTNQVMTATSVSGSNVTLGWSSVTSGSNTLTFKEMDTADVNIDDDDYDTLEVFTTGLAANTQYEFDLLLLADCSSGNENLDVQFTLTSGTITYIYHRYDNGSNGELVASDVSGSTISDLNTDSGDRIFRVEGAISTAGSGGDFMVLFKMNSGENGTRDVRINIGSFLKLR